MSNIDGGNRIISDICHTGRAAWFEYGDHFYGTFDLDKGSQSYKALKKYYNEKQKGKK